MNLWLQLLKIQYQQGWAIVYWFQLHEEYFRKNNQILLEVITNVSAFYSTKPVWKK